MKFLHTADWHIGVNNSLPGYFRRQEEMIDSIFDIAYDNDIDVVVVAGDIFDNPHTATQEDRELLCKKLLEYDAAGFHILMIPGNHDRVDATGYTALHYLALLSAMGRMSNSVVTEHTQFVQVRDTVFCLLCHSKHGFREEAKNAVEGFMSSSLKVPHNSFVMVCHETIRGSATDIKLKNGDVYKLDSGEEPPDTALPVTYWALGDIHKPQEVSPTAYYSGSPVQTRFSDGWPRGVLIVDTEEPTSPRFVPVPSNQLVVAKKGDEVPPNSYVKWVFSSRDDVPKELPSNVVKVQFVQEEESNSSLTLDVSSSLRDRLLDGIRSKGATEEDMILAVPEVDHILSMVSDV